MSSNTCNSRSRSRKRRTKSPPFSRTKDTKGTTKTNTTTTVYSCNFQQNLIDHGILPDGYEYPDGRGPEMPNNWEEIKERLARRRPSLSPSNFSAGEFRKFKRADTHALKEQLVTIIEGGTDDTKCTGGGYAFANLAPLTDGTLAHAKPDRFYGARPEQLNREIRKKLNDQVIPSQDDLPMLPNIFLETKGPDRSLATATRQACYNGAMGARGVQSLQSYQQGSTYDNNAYTITMTYHGGTLKLYTVHLTNPSLDCQPEYIMTQLDSWSMTGNVESFRQGATAYRNARDWAKEKRDECIRLANARHLTTQSQHRSLSQSPTAPDPPIALDVESDASTVTEEEEYQDAIQLHWSR